MARFNMQVSVAADSVLPRDRIVNVWHFDRPAALPENPDQLCADMATIYDTKLMVAPGRQEIDVRLYAENTPGPPLGKHVKNVGVATPSPWPREIALCLSFRGATNTPSTRGRIYFAPWLYTGSGIDVRPAATLQDRILAMADHVSGLGGVDIDWGVYSAKNLSFVKAEVAWVDDEWDTVRSRGMRATGRKQKAVTG